MTATAKLFMHGRSQAVRLPKEFRMPGKEVRVSRDGDRVILEPVLKASARITATPKRQASSTPGLSAPEPRSAITIS